MCQWVNKIIIDLEDRITFQLSLPEYFCCQSIHETVKILVQDLQIGAHEA